MYYHTTPPLLYIPGTDCSHLSLQQWEEMLSSSAAPEMEVDPTQNTHTTILAMNMLRAGGH